MSDVVRVDVGVCTYRRESVTDTLASLGAQDLPPDVRLRVIVADNEPTPAAEARVRTAGYAVANVDASLILAAPKIAPHTAEIRARVAAMLSLPDNCVGIKAKTPEGLKLANAAIAHVVVLLQKSKAPDKSRKKK